MRYSGVFSKVLLLENSFQLISNLLELKGGKIYLAGSFSAFFLAIPVRALRVSRGHVSNKSPLISYMCEGSGQEPMAKTFRNFGPHVAWHILHPQHWPLDILEKYLKKEMDGL